MFHLMDCPAMKNHAMNVIHLKYWRWLVLVVCLGTLVPVRAADKLILTSGVLAPYTTPDRKGFLDQLIATVFHEVGVDAELLIYPTATERGMLNANEGIDDGLALRIAGLEKQYPNLIQVPEPVAVNDFVAITTRHKFEATNWDSLLPYSVTYIIGWKVFEKYVPKGKELTKVRNAEQLFTLLDTGRADVALYERWQGLEQTRRMGIKVQVMDPPLVRTKMYMYLHKKHAALVPKVAEALVKLKKDGTYQRIVDATLTPLTR
jgi:polar amino acid transport system substrate-binding protein